jgi:hypothetical protein
MFNVIKLRALVSWWRKYSVREIIRKNDVISIKVGTKFIATFKHQLGEATGNIFVLRINQLVTVTGG